MQVCKISTADCDMNHLEHIINSLKIENHQSQYAITVTANLHCIYYLPVARKRSVTITLSSTEIALLMAVSCLPITGTSMFTRLWLNVSALPHFVPTCSQSAVATVTMFLLSNPQAFTLTCIRKLHTLRGLAVPVLSTVIAESPLARFTLTSKRRR